MSGILEQEFDKIRKYVSKGRQIEAVKQEDGTFVAQTVRMGATGLDLTPPIQTPLKTGEAQTSSQTAKELGPVLAGVGAGPAVGIGEVIDLGLGVLKGAYNAVNPDADQGRFEAFMTTLGEQFESGAGEGVRSIVLNLGQRAGLDEEQMEVLDEGITAGSFFGYGGAAKAAPKIAAKLGDAIEGAGDAAKARMADADGSVTLGMNIDPDPAIAAAGDAVKAMRGGVEAPELNASLKPPTETEPGVIAFHGSGKDFDEFKVEYIDTGEGAQAYGYGLYFTDSKNIAKFYKNSVSGNNVTAQTLIFDEVSKVLKGKMKLTYDIVMDIVSKKTPLSSLPKDTQSPIKQILQKNYEEELKKGKDTIYRVALEPKPEDMIDYQTTFADQPKKIQDALKAVGYEVQTNKVGMEVSPSEVRDAMRMPMSVIINKLKKEIGEKELSQKLLEQGIPGIKYRAAGSRGANVDAADVEMNYVIFDDKMIKILEKYGIVGPVAITGVAATQQEGDSDGTRS